MKITTHSVQNLEGSRTLRLRNIAMSVATSILAAGCAVTPPTVVRETVGPRIAALAEGQAGYLTVYSASVWITPPGDEGNPSVLTYTDYDVLALDGSLFKHVVNGDEEPVRVMLPKGRYIVAAESDAAGTINVPVAIETGRSTIVHLEQKQDAERAFAGIRSDDLVRLPNGQAIGFRARQTGQLHSDSPMMAARSRDHSAAMQQPKS
jgi:hypothetical protein